MTAMRHCATTLSVLASACASSMTQQAPSAASTIAITNVTIVDPGSSSLVSAGQTVLIRDSLVVGVGASARSAIPPGARVVNATGKFLIPGLWDMHVHFMNTGVTALPLLVAHGVLGVREMGGHLDSTRAWQARMRAGALVGPRIVTSGPILESPAYIANVRERSTRVGQRLADRVLPYRVGAGTDDDARRVIDSLVSLKVDFVKIRTIASAPTYFAILREARRVGLSVAGHQPGRLSLVAASDSGQHSIEHGFVPPLSQAGDAVRDSVYRAFARNGTWYTPTLVVSRAALLSGDSAWQAVFGPRALELDERRPYASDWLLGWWEMQIDERRADTSSTRAALLRAAYESSVNDVRRMHAAKVRIVAGTDAGSVLVYPGFSLHEELELLVSAGLTPADALWSATAGPAEALGLTRSHGAIAPGRIADLVLLDADPLQDVRNTRTIAAVVQNGRVLDRSALDTLLHTARGRP